MAIIPMMALLLLGIIRRVNPIFNRVFHTYDELNNVVQENVRGVCVVQSFNREEHETGKFKGISARIYEDFAAGEQLLAFNSPIMQFFMYACMILISWVGARAIVASGNSAALGMTTGDLTALFSYATQILTSLMALSMVFAMITISIASTRPAQVRLPLRTYSIAFTRLPTGKFAMTALTSIRLKRRIYAALWGLYRSEKLLPEKSIN